MSTRNLDFLHLNRGGDWPGFSLRGLDLSDDGTLTLASLPRFEGVLDPAVADAAAPDGAAGVVVVEDRVYFSDPCAHRVYYIDECDGKTRPLPCAGGEGRAPAQFDTPRGLAVRPDRRWLAVADSGNDRLQWFDLDTLRLREIWGGSGSEPGAFDDPRSVAVDRAGNTFVVDFGNRRVQKFDPIGRPLPSFESLVRAAAVTHPAEVVVSEDAGLIRVHVLDAPSGQVFVFDADGEHLWVEQLGVSGAAMGIAITDRGDTLVGDNERRRFVRCFDDRRIGDAAGYEGPVAAATIDGDDLWLHPGCGLSPVLLGIRGAFVRRGVLWGGPFGSPGRSSAWHRLRTLGPPTTGGARIRFFVHRAQDGMSPAPPEEPNESAMPFDERVWEPQGESGDDVLVGGESPRLWIGAFCEGDGLASPHIDQIRLDYDQPSYARYLPALYQRKAADVDLLHDFLALFRSVFNDVEESLCGLERLFDPGAAPAAWLPWLAGWLAVDLDEDWSDTKKRATIARAFAMSGWRGTRRGLVQALRHHAGVHAHVEEPMESMQWWALPAAADDPPADDQATQEHSVLGFTTRLASAAPQGAVLGTSATLDQSHVISAEAFGAPLFSDVAHRFTVSIYQPGRPAADRLAEIVSVIDREKPAHTLYDVCVIEPKFRVGFQATVGVDTLVGGPSPPSPQSPPSALDGTGGLVLGGRSAGRIGQHARVGDTTRLGAGGGHAPSCVAASNKNPMEEKR